MNTTYNNETIQTVHYSRTIPATRQTVTKTVTRFRYVMETTPSGRQMVTRQTEQASDQRGIGWITGSHVRFFDTELAARAYLDSVRGETTVTIRSSPWDQKSEDGER